MELEVQFPLRLEQVKIEMEQMSDYRLSSLFKMLEPVKKKYITSFCIKKFLQRMGHKVINQELISIVRRLDIDGDSRITYKEFVEAVTPISPDLIPQGAVL